MPAPLSVSGTENPLTSLTFTFSDSMAVRYMKRNFPFSSTHSVSSAGSQSSQDREISTGFSVKKAKSLREIYRHSPLEPASPLNPPISDWRCFHQNRLPSSQFPPGMTVPGQSSPGSAVISHLSRERDMADSMGASSAGAEQQTAMQQNTDGQGMIR